ncbi:conserved hypothetical protein [Gluconacetobacter diazotrophicus PA1 5]|nr:hypothetical protein [Gluconacetobacter diazotrophicus]ACI52293.1 conserved hypothetical protein [Gluconacetobacter diazotrophicus PA1 5]MBB2156846.1 hypothetical protein [Gluconacetobacter diazotrophicus]TWB04811.1 hypothetical protein FBZ86_11933 [Gluconacetobacter diazotrophicus]
MRQHKVMAETGRVPGEDDEFGVAPLAEVNGGAAHPDRTAPARVLKDDERAAPATGRPRGGRMPASAKPDHGPHR